MYPQSMFRAKLRKYQIVSDENFQFLKLKQSQYIAWASFRNALTEIDDNIILDICRKNIHVHEIFPGAPESFCLPVRMIVLLRHMSRLVGKPTMWFPNRSDTNRAAQAQKNARCLKF